MNLKWHRYIKLCIVSFLGSLLLFFACATPSQAHWADLSVAEIVVSEKQTQITLTFPTGLVAFADDNRDNQLSVAEVRTHEAALENFFQSHIRLTDGENNNATVSVKLSQTATLPSHLKPTVGTHSTLVLVYTWLKFIPGLKIHYDLFLPGIPTARCLATILQPKETQNFIFSPENRELSLMQGSVWQPTGNLIVAIAGAFLWGAMHAMSPGHGKTIVGAYLVGSRATPQHALFLGLTTTIAHTTGVFALGLLSLFGSQFIDSEQLYPWLSVLSGLIVVSIGLNLFLKRSHSLQLFRKSSFAFSHAGHHDHHHHDHHHDHHHHHHEHSHDHHHSHLPSSAEDSPVTWRSLLALGISGGLLPCPSALVLLLSATAFGRIGFGLLLVLAFSLGLAAVLTGLGLLLVSAKQLFERLPIQMRLVRILPAVSSLFVTLLGFGIITQALMQIGLVRL